MKKAIILIVLLVIVVGLIVALNVITKPTKPPDGTTDTVITNTGGGAVKEPTPAPVAIRISFPRRGVILNHFGETLLRTNILEKNYLTGTVNGVDDEVPLCNDLINKQTEVVFISEFQAILALGADFNGLIFANLGSLGRFALMILKDSPIERITDLKGKKIGLVVNSAEHSALLTWLNKEGMQAGRDVEIVAVSEIDKYNVLSAGRIDAMVASDPKVEDLYADKKVCRIIYDSHKYGVVLVAKDLWAKEPKALIRFTHALREATLFISTHRAEVNNWIKPYCGIEEDLVWRISGINVLYFSTRKINDAKIFVTDTLTGSLNNLSVFALDQKLIYKSLIMGDFISNELQQELKKEIDAQKYDPQSVKIIKQ
ncbi:MAG: ABC transporter substrate-binding protein [Planctomycetota bacterium]|nr:ABC transporter substrate-binding protein [Planctomycetota bacterium]MDI6787984.1 ABC transporter substrate-binding protein [Planctomycetota bacterium]